MCLHNGSPVGEVKAHIIIKRQQMQSKPFICMYSNTSMSWCGINRVNSALRPTGVAKLSTSFGWGKGGKVTTAGWQVTLCDPIWHVISRSSEVISMNCCYIQFTLQVWLTFGLVMTSIVSRASLMCGGMWVQTRYCSQDWAPENMRPPPTTTIQLYILFFISSESDQHHMHY